MEKLYWLDQIKPQDRANVGDKAFYLSRIIQRGYPVAPGFVVSAEFLRLFLETLNSSESLVADLPHSSLHLDVNNWRQLQQVAVRLRQEMITATIPAAWTTEIFQAVQEWHSNCLILRPSLTIPASTQPIGKISGLLDSVFCAVNSEAIAIALKYVWSQLFRARSLLYWQQAGVDLQKINLAVLVQPVDNALASGLFNAHPSGWEIESSWGLGLAISNGEIQPDAYYIQPETGRVVERQLGNKLLGYRVDDQPKLTNWENPPRLTVTQYENSLLVYPLEESQQKNYALSEEYLQQIITVGNQLVSEFGTTLTMKWTINQSTSTPKLYITQVSTPHPIIPSLYLLKGIGASGGRKLANAYVINSGLKPEQIPKGVILIAPVVTPDWLPLLQEVAGIITEQGGLTSHGAILSRELCIPAVVNAMDATILIQTGDRLLVDGDRGEIYRIKSDSNNGGEGEDLEHTSFSQSPTPLTYPPFISNLPMIATKLLVNLSQSSLIEQVKSFPVDGVGLLRSELMAVNILAGQHPNSWLLGGREIELLERWSEQVKHFAHAFAPRPVFYRSLDWRPQDLPSLSRDFPVSPQSMLGIRGTFSYLSNPAVFELELKALAAVQASGYTNISLILPFVRTVEEFVFCRRKVEQFGLTQVSQFQLWIMAEVPSVLFLLPEYVKAGVSGISIGTNDLTQLILGVDREQGQLAKIFDERHPAVMSAIAQLIKSANAEGIPCSICGQAPALYPEIIDQLVQWGITSISVEPDAVERTYQAIARAEQRLILAAARKQLGH